MVEANPDGVRLGGTNQRVTVLFCDIRGFTTMSETMAPEKVVEVLNEYFTGVTKAIFDHGGTPGQIHRRRGDGDLRSADLERVTTRNAR